MTRAEILAWCADHLPGSKVWDPAWRVWRPLRGLAAAQGHDRSPTGRGGASPQDGPESRQDAIGEVLPPPRGVMMGGGR